MTDEDLMLKYAGSDSLEAFDELYRRYSAKVYSYLRKNCFDSSNVDEIHQNIFLKMHSSRTQYNTKYPFSAWLFTIVRTSMIDYFRKIKSSDRIKDASEKLNQFSLETEFIHERENFDLENQALESLSVESRELLEMRYLKDWSFEEMAQELKVNTSAVRQRLSRLMRSLKGSV